MIPERNELCELLDPTGDELVLCGDEPRDDPLSPVEFAGEMGEELFRGTGVFREDEDFPGDPGVELFDVVVGLPVTGTRLCSMESMVSNDSFNSCMLVLLMAEPAACVRVVAGNAG